MSRFVLLALAACSHPQRPAMPKSDCIAAIEAFASAEPARLRALPASCTIADVTAALRSLDATSRGMLGKRSAALAVHYFAADQLPEIHAWADADGRVVLLDADRPPGSAAAYTTALGEPDARLDYPWKGSPLAQAEHVWAARGAVVVASPSVTGVLRVGVFAPTTLADYEAQLRYLDIETDE